MATVRNGSHGQCKAQLPIAAPGLLDSQWLMSRSSSPQVPPCSMRDRTVLGTNTSAGARRYLYILTAAAASFLFVWHAASSGSVSRSLDYLAERTCDRAGHNGSAQHDQPSMSEMSVKPLPQETGPQIPLATPMEPNKIQFLRRGIRPLFDENQPVPNSIDQPNPASLADLPMKARLDSLVKLNQYQASRTRKSHAAVVSHLTDYPVGLYGGKGIVMLAGGRYSEYAATSLNVLRQVGSTLPVEVWALDEDGEVDGWCEELAEDGIACRRLADYVDLDHFPLPYQWKVLTLLFSTFEQVIFMDADSVPVQNPDLLLRSDAFNRTGGERGRSV